MALFAKKKPAGTPTDTVIQMRQQGLSNDQIIQSLQREGFISSQIFDAMNQADIKGVVEAAPPGAPPAPSPGPAAAPAPEPAPPMAEMPPAGGFPPMPEEMPPMPAAAPERSREEIEEIVEPIIDEKWEELVKSVDKIIAWKDSAESKLVKMEQQMKDLKDRFEELHSGILAKIGEYDKGIRDVGSEIKAMDTVFKKVLPTFTENVGELSRLTKKLKTKK